MKYLYLLVISAVLFTNCSTTDTATQEPKSQEPVTEEEDRFNPEWYNSSVKSEADSLYFSGYAHAVDETEEKAKMQAEKLAKANLIYAVDRFAENIRIDLVEEQGQSSYGTPQFIMNLRNTVQDLDLSTAKVQHEVKEKDGLEHVFMRIRLAREVVTEHLSGLISESELAAI